MAWTADTSSLVLARRKAFGTSLRSRISTSSGRCLMVTSGMRVPVRKTSAGRTTTSKPTAPVWSFAAGCLVAGIAQIRNGEAVDPDGVAADPDLPTGVSLGVQHKHPAGTDEHVVDVAASPTNRDGV